MLHVFEFVFESQLRHHKPPKEIEKTYMYWHGSPLARRGSDGKDMSAILKGQRMSRKCAAMNE
jgi:hypothetical protein